jgi:hypothetical protein
MGPGLKHQTGVMEQFDCGPPWRDGMPKIKRLRIAREIVAFSGVPSLTGLGQGFGIADGGF